MNMSRAEWVERYVGKKLNTFQRTCVELICQAQGCGPYDFARTFETANWAFGCGVRFVIRPMRLSTFDFNGLTSLVIGAHHFAIRVEIEPVNFQRIAVNMHPRKVGGEQLYDRHPTIQEAIRIYGRYL